MGRRRAPNGQTAFPSGIVRCASLPRHLLELLLDRLLLDRPRAQMTVAVLQDAPEQDTADRSGRVRRTEQRSGRSKGLGTQFDQMCVRLRVDAALRQQTEDGKQPQLEVGQRSRDPSARSSIHLLRVSEIFARCESVQQRSQQRDNALGLLFGRVRRGVGIEDGADIDFEGEEPFRPPPELQRQIDLFSRFLQSFVEDERLGRGSQRRLKELEQVALGGQQRRRHGNTEGTQDAVPCLHFYRPGVGHGGLRRPDELRGVVVGLPEQFGRHVEEGRRGGHQQSRQSCRVAIHRVHGLSYSGVLRLLDGVFGQGVDLGDLGDKVARQWMHGAVTCREGRQLLHLVLQKLDAARDQRRRTGRICPNKTAQCRRRLCTDSGAVRHELLHEGDPEIRGRLRRDLSQETEQHADAFQTADGYRDAVPQDTGQQDAQLVHQFALAGFRDGAEDARPQSVEDTCLCHWKLSCGQSMANFDGQISRFSASEVGLQGRELGQDADELDGMTHEIVLVWCGVGGQSGEIRDPRLGNGHTYRLDTDRRCLTLLLDGCCEATHPSVEECRFAESVR